MATLTSWTLGVVTCQCGYTWNAEVEKIDGVALSIILEKDSFFIECPMCEMTTTLTWEEENERMATWGDSKGVHYVRETYPRNFSNCP